MEIKNEFYISLQETDREYFNVLFIEQNDERTNIPNAGEYNKALFDFISLQKYKATIDLSYICFHEAYNFTNHDLELNKIFEMVGFLNRFQKDGKASGNIIKRISFANAKFYKQVEFIRVDFEKQISFEGAYFYDNASFQESTFKEDVEGIEEKKRGTIFEGVRFHKEAIFQETEFQDQAKFFRVRFNEYTSFERAVFKKLIEFENFISKDLFYFHNVTIGKINLIGSDIERANFINLKSIDSKKPALTKENFANKDSVRLIKHHFESQNNITEANKYFAINRHHLSRHFFQNLSSYSNLPHYATFLTSFLIPSR